MRPFRYPGTILNTINHLGKFDGKADEGFFIGYSTNSKAFKVFNSRTRIVEENMHVQFSENTPNIVRNGPNWIFDRDTLTKSMNYKSVVAGNQSNGNAGTKACDDAGKARVKTVLLPLWTQDPSFSSSTKDSFDAGFKPSGEEEKKDGEDLRNEDGNPSEEGERVDQEKDANVNNTDNINTVSPTDNAAGIEDTIVDENIVYGCADDLNMPNLEDIVYSDDDEDVGAEADMNNMDAFIPVSPISTTRVHKDHPVEQISGDLNSAPQTRRMTKNLNEHGLFSSVQQRTNHKDFQNCLFACFLSQEEPKNAVQALKDPNWIEAMQEELLQFKLQEVWTLVEVYKVEKTLYGLDQAPRAWYETLSTYLLDNGFQRGKIDNTLFIKRNKSDILLVQVNVADIIFGSTRKEMCTEFEKIMHKKFQMSYMGELTFFLASTPMETHKPLLKNADGEDVDEHLYRSMIGSLMYLTSSRPDIMFAVCACVRFQVNPKVSHLHAVKRIFRYLKGQPKLGLWYHKDSPFDLVAYTDSDYAGASLDRKSTTGGCQFLGCRLISRQCKKQTVVANSTTKAEYIAASNCCGQVLWIQNQLLDYGYNFMQTKIHIDNESTICIVKNPVFYSKTKHIEIMHHFIRDSNEKKLIQIIKIHTDQNVANLLTKAFDVSRFQYLVVSIGMLNL
ncbi:putative ribonuclease H-like domain-containing protein [Tanacetum coccineum]